MWMPLAFTINVVLALSSLATCAVYMEQSQCAMHLVESIPENVTFNGTWKSLETYETWKWLIDNSSKELKILSFYWTLLGRDVMQHPDPSSKKGEDILRRLQEKGSQIPIRIATDNSTNLEQNNTDLKFLKTAKQVEIVSLNFSKLMGAGVLHTKVWIADDRHAYIGSANMDWRSLTQVKEMGILLQDCPDLVLDLSKIFMVYWIVGKTQSVPLRWPADLDTRINVNNPYGLQVGKHSYNVVIGASPPQFCTSNRSRDLDAILYVIRTAKKFIHIAVMDYAPIINEYDWANISYWPQIEDAIKTAAIRNKVEVKLLASYWKHSSKFTIQFSQAFQALDKIRGKLIKSKFFIVPHLNRTSEIPFARVNHNKYIVTDSAAVICTSNWSGDYFENTGGVGFFLEATSNVTGSTVSELQDVFDRDWNSAYSHDSPKHEHRHY